MRKMRKPAVGARPGTLAIPAGARPVVRVLSYDENTIEGYESMGVEEIRALKATGRKLWVDIQGLSDEDLLRGLAGLFSIHPLALEDVVHVPSRPKAEPYHENLLVITQMIRLRDDGEVHAEQVSILIGRDFLLTFRERPGDSLAPVRKRLQVEKSDIRTESSDYLGYAILDTIIDAYFPVMDSLSERIEGLEERILVDASPETLRELNWIKGQLLTVRRTVAPQRESVKTLIRDENELVGETSRTHLRDTHDHVVQLLETVEGSREVVNGLINTYLSVMSNRMNEVMKHLTIVASIFVPLTFLAGVYGMNFEHMPELQTKWGYPMVLAGMALAGLGMVVYFWRKGWIGRRR